jgi:iron complex outermembrane recepter protein
MIYTTASKGFRLGGPNAPLISACDAELAALGLTKGPGSYAHDSLWNYEVGTKWRPSGNVAINADVFYDKWSQLQQQIDLNNCGAVFTTNLGSARNYGAEIDVTARPIAGLTTSLAGGYNNSRLQTAVPSMGIQAGAHVEGVPDWNASTSIEYQHPVAGTMVGVIRGNYTFVAASYGALNPTNPDYNRPGYGLAGASIGAIFSKWEISLFAKNLFNDQKIIQTPNHAAVPLGYVPTPRTVGVTISGHL